MSLLDNASLVLTPNAYKEGKLYSVIPSNGNGDFTATRATTATRVNSDGLVDLVPYNLLQYSEVFSNAYWVKTNSSISANVTTAPDGTLTADKLVENTTSTSHQVLSSSNSVVNGANYTLSLYAKAAERNWILVIYFDGTTVRGRYFDLSNGTGGTNWAGTPVTNTITSVGNDWYRITLTFSATSANCTLGCYLANADNSNVYLGNGSSGAFIWGAQLVEGTSARDYLRTETRLNIPRVDYSLGGCPNILLEPQRTNLALQSSSFDSATWLKVAATTSANSTTSPSGILDADTFSANGANSDHTIYQLLTTTSGTAYTFSSYIKANTGRYILVRITTSGTSLRYGITFDLQTGTITQTSTTATAPSGISNSITNVGNGWYRISLTLTASGTSSGMVISTSNTATPTLNASLDYSYTGTESYFLWGAQLEAGTYSTSFIPTTTASVTRNADTITRNNIFTNGLITASGGTWFVELRNNRSLLRDAFSNGIFFSGSNGSLQIRNVSAGRLSILKIVGGTSTTLYTTLTDTVKVAIKWNGSTADVFVNGVKQVTATAFTETALQTLDCLGADVPKYINEMALFPTPLTDAQCLALTA